MKSDKNCLEITWLGHAAFLLETGSGLKIMLDPYRTPDAGQYAPIETPADIVVVSHLNPKYHSHWEAATGSPVRLNGLDLAAEPNGVTVLGITFQAVQVWESAARTVPVSMPYFQVDGISVCHSGDLGHALTPEEAVPLRGVDVFLAVAGGPPTLSLPDMKAAIDLIAPRIVIPMHYQNGKSNLPLQRVDEFLALFAPEQVILHPLPTLELCPSALPSERRVIVLPSAL